jgi:hypothetical protein
MARNGSQQKGMVRMKRKRPRLAFVALPVFLVLVLSLGPTPSHTAVPSPHDRAAAANGDSHRRELAAWMVAGGLPADAERRRVVTKSDLDAALGSSPPRGGLFTLAGNEAQRSRWLSRLPYGSIMAKAAERNRVDGLLLAAMVEAESRFVPHARSSGGALGLMQLLPATAAQYGTKNPLDPCANLEAGSRYLRRLLDRFQGRPELALAAYNTGPECVARYGRVPPYRETQRFVKKVMALYGQHQHELLAQSLDPRNNLLAAARSGRSGSRGLTPAREPGRPPTAPTVALGR